MKYFLHRKTEAFPVIFIFMCLFSSKLAASSKDFSIKTVCRGNPITWNLTYQSNVASLLSELASKSSTSNQPLRTYSNATVGKVPDMAYGSHLCRGDLDAQLCHDCVVNVTQALSKEQATYECFGFDDQCMVQYADHPIYSLYRKGFVLSYGGIGGIIPNYEHYNKTLSMSITELVKEAALGQWTRTNFATRVANVTGSNEKIYTLVQCSPDISAMNCSSCLADLYSYVPARCCGPTSGAYVNHANCMLMYNNQSFFGGGHAPDDHSGAHGGFVSFPFHPAQLGKTNGE
ncbi:hypothetical protein Cgig2_011187 [Carnegiea gigantea]|uniref:Gnk2-homologous domain-containing protein n=1 Tax=Carnegiea gigantea TaxID=171969 RepID=A0A9Q1KEZ1_9CARY|nr:hypothetical protein Cgig2_011187 [Carnegiea gigantea]